MAAKNPDPMPLYSCEICGEEGLTEDEMRSHMLTTHIEGAISCPFCDLGDISANEMVLHVNAVHLDYLPMLDGRVSSPESYWEDALTTNNNISPDSDIDLLNGSPQRSQLKLNLNPPRIQKSDFCSPNCSNDVITLCPICNYANASPTKLQEHINRQHFDLTSPSFPEFINTDKSGSRFLCPLCNRSLETIPDLELHVNMDHREILSPIKSTQVTPGDENSNECCPVCGKSNFSCSLELANHIEDHFDGKSPNGVARSPLTPLIGSLEEREGGPNSDHMLALEMERREREEQRIREQREFKLLQAQYGMDNQGLIPKIRAFSLTTGNVERVWLATTVDHYGSTYGDKGWGCGYRNVQMLLSTLMHHTGYNHCLFNGRNSLPSISKIQELIETAWRFGFDPQGCEQLGGKLHNTRKWIGATEVVTFLSSFRIRCKLVDCHCPTGPNCTHPEMFKWVKDYFSKDENFKAPIYLQHHGHSRTIIGIEELKDGGLQLIVLDPSHSKGQMEQFGNTACNANAMRLVRRPLSALKARQYQLVSVDGVMENDKEYQESKILHSFRLPPDNGE